MRRLCFEDLLAMTGFAPAFALIGIVGGMMVTFGVMFVLEGLRYTLFGVAGSADYSRIFTLGSVLGALAGVAGGEYWLVTFIRREDG